MWCFITYRSSCSISIRWELKCYWCMQYILFVHATGMGHLQNRVADIYSTKNLRERGVYISCQVCICMGELESVFLFSSWSPTLPFQLSLSWPLLSTNIPFNLFNFFMHTIPSLCSWTSLLNSLSFNSPTTKPSVLTNVGKCFVVK